MAAAPRQPRTAGSTGGGRELPRRAPAVVAPLSASAGAVAASFPPAAAASIPILRVLEDAVAAPAAQTEAALPRPHRRQDPVGVIWVVVPTPRAAGAPTNQKIEADAALALALVAAFWTPAPRAAVPLPAVAPPSPLWGSLAATAAVAVLVLPGTPLPRGTVRDPHGLPAPGRRRAFGLWESLAIPLRGRLGPRPASLRLRRRRWRIRRRP